MADYLPFHDISYAQGVYDMTADPNPIVMIKMSGGDGPIGSELYFDSQAYNNYTNAVKTGKAPAGYHFAGAGDPVAEADYFYRAMSPLAENDVMALDWEIEGYTGDPVAWCLSFVTEIHNKCGVWPLIYLNISTLNGHDWSPVLANCGLWLAAPSYGFDETIPEVKVTYVAQQGPIVNGVDTDAFFGTLDEFKKYGYHAPAPVVAPAVPLSSTTAPSPPSPVTEPVSTTPTSPSPTPVTIPTVTPTPSVGTAIDIVKPTVKKPAPSLSNQVTVVENYVKEDEDAAVRLINALKGKKTYTASTLMLLTSVEKYLTGSHDLSSYLTTVQGLFGAVGVLGITTRAALAKIENRL